MSTHQRLDLPGDYKMAMLYTPILDISEALDAPAALERLTLAIERPDAELSDATREDISKIVELLDGQPRAIDAVAKEIQATSARQVHTRLEHELLCEVLDARAWGFAWDAFSSSHRRVLCAAVCCDADFDAEAMAAISGVDEVRPVLDELVEMACLSRHEDRSAWCMSWSPRMLVMQHIEDVHVWRRRHAEHFLERVEPGDEAPVAFVEPNLERAFTFGMSHDADIVARAARALYHIRRAHYKKHDLTAMLEGAVARRPCPPGDLLGLALLVLLGESHARHARYEKAIKTLELALALDPPRDHVVYGEIHCMFAICLSYMAQARQAHHMATIARESFTQLGAQSHLVRALHVLSVIHVNEGDDEAALEVFEELSRRAPERAMFWNNFGSFMMVMGQHEDARRCFERAMTCATFDQSTMLSTILDNTAIIHLLHDEPELAASCVKRADEWFSSTNGTPNGRYFHLCSHALYKARYGFLLGAYQMSCEATQLNAAGCLGFAIQCAMASFLDDLSSAHRALDQLRRPDMLHKPYMASFIRFSEFALEMGHILSTSNLELIEPLRAQLDMIDRTKENCALQVLYICLFERLEKLRQPSQLLWVHADGHRARRGDHGEAVDLQRSQVTRQLLMKLVTHHQAHPGELCSIEALFEAAWPDHVWNLSARARLHTAIHRLRDRLLGELLITHDEGYTLATHCQIEPMI